VKREVNISVVTWYDEAKCKGKWFEAWNEDVDQFQHSYQCLPTNKVECEKNLLGENQV